MTGTEFAQRSSSMGLAELEVVQSRPLCALYDLPTSSACIREPRGGIPGSQLHSGQSPPVSAHTPPSASPPTSTGRSRQPSGPSRRISEHSPRRAGATRPEVRLNAQGTRSGSPTRSRRTRQVSACLQADLTWIHRWSGRLPGPQPGWGVKESGSDRAAGLPAFSIVVAMGGARRPLVRSRWRRVWRTARLCAGSRPTSWIPSSIEGTRP